MKRKKFKPESSDYLSPSKILSTSKDLKALQNITKYYTRLLSEANNDVAAFNTLIEAATKRGNEIDEAVSDYYNDNFPDFRHVTENGKKVNDYFDDKKIHSIEQPVYDDTNAIRGYYDLIEEFKTDSGVTINRHVCDCKGMSTIRRLDYMSEYLEQLSFYRSALFNETDGAKILAFIDGVPTVQVVELPERLLNFYYNNLLRKADIARKMEVIQIPHYKVSDSYFVPGYYVPKILTEYADAKFVDKKIRLSKAISVHAPQVKFAI